MKLFINAVKGLTAVNSENHMKQITTLCKQNTAVYHKSTGLWRVKDGDPNSSALCYSLSVFLGESILIAS